MRQRKSINSYIRKVLPYIENERELIYKLIELDESKDLETFNAVQKVYNESMKLTDKLIRELYENADFDDIMDCLSDKIRKLNDRQRPSYDYVTILGLVRNIELNRLSYEEKNIPADLFSSEFSMTLYEIYLWYVRENEMDEELRESLRMDLIMKAVDSRVFRYYFSGNYEIAANISDPYNYYNPLEKPEADITYSAMMIERIGLSNHAPELINSFDKLSYDSREKMIELEFAALSAILDKRKTLIPPNNIEYTSYTEDRILNASVIYDKYKNSDEELEMGPRKLLQVKS